VPTPPPTAVVTGAGSGLGRVIARSLLDSGHRVALVGRRAHTLADTAQDHPSALTIPADVSDPDAVAALFRKVVRTWGRVDLLVNNAGVFGPIGTPDEISVTEWQSSLAINITAAFLCAREAFAAMRHQRPQGGRIINNGSISAHAPRPGAIAYTTAKHAMSGLTRSLSLDGRAYGIACGQIDIGNAATDMTSAVAAGARQADGTVRPEPTFDARHVAEAIQYMAQLPLEANVQFLTLTATTMPFIGRG
jgi:NAD(P)-dependent dehydrogenase (short-subunit alcohol dehydrogenase family)